MVSKHTIKWTNGDDKLCTFWLKVWSWLINSSRLLYAVIINSSFSIHKLVQLNRAKPLRKRCSNWDQFLWATISLLSGGIGTWLCPWSQLYKDTKWEAELFKTFIISFVSVLAFLSIDTVVKLSSKEIFEISEKHLLKLDLDERWNKLACSWLHKIVSLKCT